MKMEYVNVNGYLIPKLENGPITDNTIGKYGMMRARYLDEHRPMERDQMLLDGTLAQHLTNIDCEAHRQVGMGSSYARLASTGRRNCVC